MPSINISTACRVQVFQSAISTNPATACSTRAISNDEIKPVLQGDLITPQTVRSYQPDFCAAFIAHVEATNVSPQRFIDGAKHRAELPPGYNSHRRVNAEPGYNATMDNERMLLWPPFITSFCLWDALQDNRSC